MQLFSYYFVFLVRFILFSCLFMYVMLICLINFSRFVGDTGTNVITKVYLITNILRIMSNKSWVGETFLGLALLLLLLRQFACRTWIQIFRICSFTTRETCDFVLYSFLFFLLCENMAPLLQAQCKLRKLFNIFFLSFFSFFPESATGFVKSHAIYINYCDPFSITLTIALVRRWSFSVLKLVSIRNYVVSKI